MFRLDGSELGIGVNIRMESCKGKSFNFLFRCNCLSSGDELKCERVDACRARVEGRPLPKGASDEETVLFTTKTCSFLSRFVLRKCLSSQSVL